VIVDAKVDSATVAIEAVCVIGTCRWNAVWKIVVSHRLAVSTKAFAFHAWIVVLDIAWCVHRRRNLSASIVDAFVDFAFVFFT